MGVERKRVVSMKTKLNAWARHYESYCYKYSCHIRCAQDNYKRLGVRKS